ncbi:MAG: complex I subunit 5 family protein [Bacillota bacterium]
MSSFLILTPVLFPILGVLVLLAIKFTSGIKRELKDKLYDYSIFLFTLFSFISMLGFYPAIIRAGEKITLEFPNILLVGITFQLDALSYYLILIISFIWTLIVMYSLDYMKEERSKMRFHLFVLLNFAACIAFFLAGDLLTMFLFFEALTVLSYVLVAHAETQQAIKAANRYIFLSLIGGLGILFAIFVIYNTHGSLAFADIPYITTTTPYLTAAFFLSIFSFGIKAGIFPFHIWLPIAHPAAPSPASAILSGIMIKTGAFGMIRIMYNMYDIEMIRDLNWHIYLMIIAGITIFLGSAGAIFEYDIKRRLAYSSISQIGYIMLGMTFLNYSGVLGNVFHMTAHAAMKACLFMAAGAIMHQTGERDLRRMSGIGKMMPFTMLSFTIAALAMIGLPPLTGFITKWELSMGAIQADHVFYVFLLLLSSLMNLIYYSPIIIAAFFKERDNDSITTERNEVSWKMLTPIVVLALSTFVFDIVPANIPLQLAEKAASILIK